MMISRIFIFLTLFVLIEADNSMDEIVPRVETFDGSKALLYWKKSFNRTNSTIVRFNYDINQCHSFIGEKAVRGQYTGIGLTPDCHFVQADLVDFKDAYKKVIQESYRDLRSKRNDECRDAGLSIVRLHHNDKGIYTYHLTRVRLKGNRFIVTILSKSHTFRDNTYSMKDDYSGRSSAQYTSVFEKPSDQTLIRFYTINYEINAWFHSSQGIHLYLFRLIYKTKSENGYECVAKHKLLIPTKVLDPGKIYTIISCRDEKHYILMKNEKGTIDAYMIFNNALILHKYDRMEKLDLNIFPNVLPTFIVGEMITYEPLNTHNGQCGKAQFFTIDANSDKLGSMRNVTDPPLPLNIYNSHRRISYPFVRGGDIINKNNFDYVILVIWYTVGIMILSRILILRYDALPIRMARSIKTFITTKKKERRERIERKNVSKARKVWRNIRKIIGKCANKVYRALIWIISIEGVNRNEDEEDENYSIPTYGDSIQDSRSYSRHR